LNIVSEVVEEMFASMTEDQRTRLVEVSIQQMEVDWMEKYKGKKTLIEHSSPPRQYLSLH